MLANREIDKYKILNVAVLSNMNIINATTMGLPQDEVNMIEIEVEVKVTSTKGIETTEW